MLKRFWRNESGTTMIEYAIVAGVVSIAIITGARLLGANLNANFYQKVSATLT